MLVSDKYKFIIACPTKTGTNSMRALAEQAKRAGLSERVLTLLTGEKRTRHRVSPPTGKEDYMRFMMWRNDKDRLVSMYEYLRRKDWEWSAGDILRNEAHYGREEAWIRFLRLIAATRQADGYFAGGRRGVHGSRPYMWTDLIDECAIYLGGEDADGSSLPWWEVHEPRLLNMDDLQSDWNGLLLDLEVEEDEMFELSVVHRNATPADDRLFSDRAAYWSVDGASRLFAEINSVRFEG